MLSSYGLPTHPMDLLGPQRQRKPSLHFYPIYSILKKNKVPKCCKKKKNSIFTDNSWMIIRSFPFGLFIVREINWCFLSNWASAELLGIKKLLPAYLDPTLQPSDLLTGVSFASGASGYDPLTSKIPVHQFSFEEDIDHFFNLIFLFNFVFIFCVNKISQFFHCRIN